MENFRSLVVVFFSFVLIYLVNFSLAKNFEIYNVSNPSQTYFIVNGQTGYVGIGTNAPGYPLDVVGNARISSNLIVSGYGNLGSLQIGGVEVVDSSRNLKNINAVAQSLIPSTHNTYDLGSSDYAWRNLYIADRIIMKSSLFDVSSSEQTLWYFLPRILQQNIFAFAEAVSIEYWDDGTGNWVVWDTTSWKNMLDGKATDSIFRIDYDHKKFRIVLSKDYYEKLDWLVLYVRPDKAYNVNVTIEYDTDPSFSAPVIGYSKTISMAYDHWYFIRPNSDGYKKTYVRITMDIQLSSTTDYFDIGEMIGLGRNTFIHILFYNLFDWDRDRNLIFYGSLTPSTHNTYDLGSDLVRWKNGYFSGNLYVSGTIYGNVVGGITSNGDLNMNGYNIYNANNVNATSFFQNGVRVIDTVTAGSGLSGGGNGPSVTLNVNVNANKGLQIVSDAIETKIGTGLGYDASGNIYVIFGSTSGTAAEGNKQITITAGSGLTGGGTITIGSGGTITISHADTSSQASVDNSGGTVVQDITLDTYGHVTGINSVNLDNRYSRKNIDETITGKWTFNNDVKFMKNIYVAGNISYVNSNTLNVNGSIIPPLDNWFDIGSSSNRWKDGYFAGSLKVGYVYISSEPPLQSGSDAVLRTTQGAVWSEIRAMDGDTTNRPGVSARISFDSGSTWTEIMRVRDDWAKFRGDLLPMASNVKNIGSPSLKWKDAYFAGTVHAASFDGSISASNVEDIWVNESGDTMSGKLTITGGGLEIDNSYLLLHEGYGIRITDDYGNSTDLIRVYGPWGYGFGSYIQSGGQMIVGSGESAGTTYSNIGNAGDETLYLTSDNNIKLITGLQSGWNSRKEMMILTNSYVSVNGTVKPLSSNTYDLGTSSLQWNNIYGRTIYQNGKQVIDTLTAGNGISISGSGNSRTISVVFGSTSGTAAEGNKQITITAGSGLTGGGTITIGSGGTITISHADTSNQGSVDNSGNTFIQDIALDAYGHVTGITSATVSESDPEVATTTANRVCYGTGSAVTCNDNLYWDSTNDRLAIGTTSASSRLYVYAPDTAIADIYAVGSSQGTGMVYVGQSTNYGGGIVYNGDDNPDLPFTVDAISFFRRSGGTNYEVFYYMHNSNTVYYNGDINMKDHNVLDANTVTVNTIYDPEDAYLSIADNVYFTVNGTRIYLKSKSGQTYAGIYTSSTSNRIYVRAENTDDVAEFASYGLFLPKDVSTGLYVRGGVRINYGGSEFVVDNSGNVNADGGTFYVDAANNRVGIGTTSPAQKLDVNGNALVRNTLYLDSGGNSQIYWDSANSRLVIKVV